MTEVFVFKHALSDSFRLRRLVVWAFVALILFAISKLFMAVMRGSPDPRDVYLQLSSTLVYRILPLASAIFTSMVISAEVEQKTIVYLLTRPVPRWKLVILRSAATMLVVFLLTTLCAVAVSLAAYGGDFLSNPYLFRDIKAFFVGSMAYGGLFLLMSLMFNRSMILALLFAFVWETSVPNMPGDNYYLSIFSHLQAIAETGGITGSKGFLGFVSGQLQPNLITPSTAWPVMILLIGTTLALSGWWFSNFEYLPREDAE